MKSTFITKFRQRRARKKHERKKALRDLQDDDAMNRVAKNAAGTMGGGTGGA